MDDVSLENDDRNWTQIRAALSNDKWDFRTIDGIAKETGLDGGDVKASLERHADEVRVALSTDNRGRVLYTLRSRPRKLKEILSDFKSVLSTDTST